MKDYIITKNAIIVKMEKPLFGSKYYVRDKYIKMARRYHKTLVLDTPDGKATYTAKQWMKGAEKMEKVFNFPDNPMILWGKHIRIDVEKRKERKKAEEKLESPRIEPETKGLLASYIVKNRPELAKKLNI